MPAPASSQFSTNTVQDYLFSFEDGMNSGESPLLLARNQLAWASNLTTRGTLIHPRPVRRNLTLQFSSQAVQTAVTKGLFQGYCYYKPDVGNETLIVSISGRLYQFTPIGTVATVADVTGANPQSATALQCWLWQAENYVIWNDGINLPVFFNGTTTARSAGTVNPNPIFTVSTFLLMTTPNSLSVVNLTGNYTGNNGDVITVNPGTTIALNGTITAGAGTPNITVQFTNADPYAINPGNQVQSTTPAFTPQFPIGRQGDYGRGRIWMALADGQQFIAGDIVGGPSGTKALNFRDAILNITENQYLTGGGTFRVPGSIGSITAMIFTAQLDAALGQGPLMVFTATNVFSCNAPVDRLTWQSLTNPILTEPAIGNGAMGQYSTFLANSDTQYRSPDGLRSLILASQDFNTWIRTPISHEVERVLNRDNAALLAFGSGVLFDNRILMTASPISTPQGVYHQALVVLNTDLQTTVREKKPPAYDGVWPGMNILGITTGLFALVQRCYTFVFNPVLSTLELWELMPEAASQVENNPNPPIVGDNGTDAIQWWFESPVLFKERTPAERTFKQLNNGEIMVDKLVGRVDFQAFWKPDQYPCWIPWIQWSECATTPTTQAANNKPQFRPRMGLGTPPSSPCDPSTNRPLREGFTFQLKLVVTGQCEFIGARFEAVVKPQPTFAPPACDAICG
jgi:hypothetical protein